MSNLPRSTRKVTREATILNVRTICTLFACRQFPIICLQAIPNQWQLQQRALTEYSRFPPVFHIDDLRVPLFKGLIVTHRHKLEVPEDICLSVLTSNLATLPDCLPAREMPAEATASNLSIWQLKSLVGFPSSQSIKYNISRNATRQELSCGIVRTSLDVLGVLKFNLVWNLSPRQNGSAGGD